jgi:hypothetical protein
VVSIVAALGVLVSPTVAALVYWDATNAGLSRSARLPAAVCAGAVSFGGFLVPGLAEGGFARVYLGLKPTPVVVSPLELLFVRLAAGLAVSAMAVLGCGVGFRVAARR